MLTGRVLILGYVALLLSGCSHIPRLKRECSDGEAPSCSTLGRIYQNGDEGQRINRQLAYFYFRRGCDAGDQDDCRVASSVSSPARAAPPPPLSPPARLTCDNTDTTGINCLKVGIALVKGEGAEKNLELAQRAFKISCGHSNTEGCNWFMLTMRDRCNDSQQAACAEFKAYVVPACNKGEMAFCEEWGRMCWYSLPSFYGCKAKGEKLLRAACQNGIQKACKVLSG